MHGDYRKVFARAEELEVQSCKFEKKDEDLLEPFEDLSTLAKRKVNGQHSAILFQFRLQKSTYATMLIREFCHISSSFENQELINKTADTELEDSDKEEVMDEEKEKEIMKE